MIERRILVPTASGRMNTFISHPERNAPFPIILFYMDAPGIREELRDMARRLACVGYYVMLPNLYYRADVEELGPFVGAANATTREKMMALMESLTIAKVMDDTDALLAFADKDAAASKGKIGAVGYCMSGQYAIGAAGRYPERVAAAASIYGVRLMTDAPDSPHLAARKARGELYIACAETDHWAPLDMVAAFKDSLREGGVNAEVEIYARAEHGFAFPQRAAYNRDAAERHWERLFALFGRGMG